MFILSTDQMLVLELLRDQEMPGRELRRLLHERGRRISGPHFYAMMLSLEFDGLVTHADKETVVASGAAVIVLRHYWRTKDGHFALAESGVDNGERALILPTEPTT